MNVTNLQTRPSRPSAPLPAELVASTTFLMKRLGFAAKERALEAYEEAGISPYSYAILLALEEGSHETQGAIADSLGYDRGQLVGLLDEARKARSRRTTATRTTGGATSCT